MPDPCKSLTAHKLRVLVFLIVGVLRADKKSDDLDLDLLDVLVASGVVDGAADLCLFLGKEGVALQVDVDLGWALLHEEEGLDVLLNRHGLVLVGLAHRPVHDDAFLGYERLDRGLRGLSALLHPHLHLVLDLKGALAGAEVDHA